MSESLPPPSSETVEPQSNAPGQIVLHKFGLIALGKAIVKSTLRRLAADAAPPKKKYTPPILFEVQPLKDRSWYR